MAKRPKISTTINEIADYWTNTVCESELSVDWSEARERC